MKSRLLIFLFLLVTSIAYAQDKPFPDLEPIIADNAAQLVQLERYGNGLLGNALVWSPDGKTLAVGGSAGLWLYNGDDLNLPPQFIDTDQWVTPQAFNFDGTLLAFSSERKMVLWDVKTQIEIAHFDDSVVAAFSPDGKILATATIITTPHPDGGYVAEGLIYLWDPTTRTKISTLNFDRNYQGLHFVHELTFSPDGAWIASVSGSDETDSCADIGMTIQIWDVAAAIQKGEVLGADNYFSDRVKVHFSPDGQLLAGLDDFPYGNGKLYFWDMKSGEPFGEPLELIDNENLFMFHQIAFSNDWGRVAATTYVPVPENQEGYNPSGVGIWDVQTGELLLKVYLGLELADLAFSPDGKQLVGLSNDTYGPSQSGTLWMLNIAEQAQQTIPFERLRLPAAYNLVLRPSDSDVFFIDTSTGDLTAFDLETGEENILHQKEDQSAIISQDGSRYAAKVSEQVHVWDADTSEVLSTLQRDFSGNFNFVFSPDASLIASLPSIDSVNEPVQIWDSATGELLQTIDTTGYVVFSPDNHYLTISNSDNETRIFDWQTGDEIAFLEGQEPQFSADGSRLMYLNRPEQEPSLFTYKEIRVWDVNSGRDLLTGPYYPPSERDDALTGMKLSPDGTVLAYSTAALTRSSCYFNSIQIYGVDQQQSIGGLGVKAANYAFSPDSSLLAAAVNDYIVLLDAKTGDEILWLEGHTSTVRTVTFNCTGTLLLTTSADGTVRLWGVPRTDQ